MLQFLCDGRQPLRRVFRGGLDQARGVLGMAHLLSDVQGFNLHARSLSEIRPERKRQAARRGWPNAVRFSIASLRRGVTLAAD